jgi:hypothetical protein
MDSAEVAAMAIERRKPFKSDGSGYVDVLVWHRVRELVTHREVALISDNYKDFGGSKQGGLDAELEEDLNAHNAAGRVTRYPSPSDFHAAALDREELYEAQLREEFKSDAFMGTVKREIFALLDDQEARSAAGWGSIAPAESVFFESGEVETVALLEVTDAEADYGYVNLEAEAFATYEFPVLYSEAWEAYEDGELESLEMNDPEEIVASASRTVRLQLSVDAEYDPASGELSDFELTNVELERQ